MTRLTNHYRRRMCSGPSVRFLALHRTASTRHHKRLAPCSHLVQPFAFPWRLPQGQLLFRDDRQGKLGDAVLLIGFSRGRTLHGYGVTIAEPHQFGKGDHHPPFDDVARFAFERCTHKRPAALGAALFGPAERDCR